MIAVWLEKGSPRRLGLVGGEQGFYFQPTALARTVKRKLNFSRRLAGELRGIWRQLKRELGRGTR